MRLELDFEMDNTAFNIEPENECKRILDEISQAVIDGSIGGKCIDADGNTIGYWEVHT